MASVPHPRRARGLRSPSGGHGKSSASNQLPPADPRPARASAHGLHPPSRRFAMEGPAQRNRSPATGRPPLVTNRSTITRCSRAWHNLYTRCPARPRLYRGKRPGSHPAAPAKGRGGAWRRVETHRSGMGRLGQLAPAPPDAEPRTCARAAPVDDRHASTGRRAPGPAIGQADPPDERRSQAAARGRETPRSATRSDRVNDGMPDVDRPSASRHRCN